MKRAAAGGMPVWAYRRIFASIFLIIFGVELSVLVAVSTLPPMSPLAVNIWSALLTAALCALLIRFIIARPLALATETDRLRLAIATESERLQLAIATETNRVRQELTTETERLRLEARVATILQTSVDGILTTDAAGIISQFNAGAERIFGYTADQVMGRNVSMLLPFQAEGVPREGRNSKGAVFPVEVTISKLGEGDTAMRTAIVRDVTREKLLQAQLLQSQKMESVGRLAGGVAHDFNNLLSVILGWTEIAMSDIAEDDVLRPSLDEVMSAGHQAAGLTKQLLAFSRQQVVEPALFNVNEVIAEMEVMLRRLLSENIELTTRAEPELGAVLMDRGQLGQVLMNLAINARDAMPMGGKLTIETANVTVDSEYPRSHADAIAGDYVLLAVSDSGTGMTDEVKAHIFEPFFSTKGLGKGTGLGLATSYGIVKQAKGHIEVYSEVGVGTTMKVYLPRSTEGAEVVVVRKRRDTPLMGMETILLVEDEPAVRRVTQRMLEARGYRMLLASSGEEALRMIGELAEPLHLLLTDVVLAGGINGRELAERVQLARPGLKVLYISGYTSDVTFLHGILEQSVMLVQKPFTQESLGEKVRQVLDTA